MNLIEKEIYADRKASVHWYYNHKIRHWFYKRLAKYYHNKYLKKWLDSSVGRAQD